MRSYGNRQRTRADRLSDLNDFLNSARPNMIRDATWQELSRRYGTDPRETECRLLAAQGKLERGRALG